MPAGEFSQMRVAAVCQLESLARYILVPSVSNVSAVFLAAVSHGLGMNPAAVRLFRKRFAKAIW